MEVLKQQKKEADTRIEALKAQKDATKPTAGSSKWAPRASDSSCGCVPVKLGRKRGLSTIGTLSVY